METTRRCFDRFLVVFVPLILALASPLRAEEGCGTAPHRTVHVSRHLSMRLEAMLERSPTFRAQYERLSATPLLLVGVRVDPTMAIQHGYRALSTFRRYDTGLLVASVVIGPGDGQIEWLAHEFEHILEQLDGWNLAAMAAGRASGVWYSSLDCIETIRAIEAGRAVLGEVRGRIRRSDKLVETMGYVGHFCRFDDPCGGRRTC
jgi:hypothetical protein